MKKAFPLLLVVIVLVGIVFMNVSSGLTRAEIETIVADENANILTSPNIEYGVTDSPSGLSTNYFVDRPQTTARIDEVKKEITLPEYLVGNRVEFNYLSDSVMTQSVLMNKQTITQYGKDSAGMKGISDIEIVSPEKNVLAQAMIEDSSDMIAVYSDPATKNIELGYFGLTETSSQKVGYLDVTSFGQVLDIIVFDSGEIALLTFDRVEFFMFDSQKFIHVGFLDFTLDSDPVGFAQTGELEFVVLGENSLELVSFNEATDKFEVVTGSKLDLSSHKEGFFRSVGATDDFVFVIDDLKVIVLNYNSSSLSVNTSLFVGGVLEDPIDISGDLRSNDFVVLDRHSTSGSVNYFEYTGSSFTKDANMSFVMNDFDGRDETDFWYRESGELVSRPFYVSNVDFDEIYYGFYSDLASETGINVSVSFNESGVWKDVLELSKTGVQEPLINGIVDGYFVGDTYHKGVWGEFSRELERLYPDILLYNLDTEVFPDSEIEVGVDDEGNYIVDDPGAISKPTGYSTMLEDLDVAEDFMYVRFKFELTTNNMSNTPKIFVPEGSNSITGVTDNVAIRIVGEDYKVTPDVEDIDPEHKNVFSFTPVDGWVYTTTPTIPWSVHTAHTDVSYYDLVLMTQDSGGNWDIIYNAKINDTGSLLMEHRVPTASDTVADYTETVDKRGPLHSSGDYRFYAFARTYYTDGTTSDFSEALEFKVLAFERPRVVRAFNLTDDERGIYNLVSEDDTRTHLRAKNMTVQPGQGFEFIIDSVGPVNEIVEVGDMVNATDTLDQPAPFFYLNSSGDEWYASSTLLGSRFAPTNRVNSWRYIVWSPASYDLIEDETLMFGRFISQESIGGHATMLLSDVDVTNAFADGVVEVSDSVYLEWDIYQKGSD